MKARAGGYGSVPDRDDNIDASRGIGPQLAEAELHVGQEGSIAVVAERGDEGVLLTLSGNVTILVADQLLEAAREAAEQGDVTVDLASVEHIDTACLQVLLSLNRTLQSRSKRLSVTRLPDSVRRFLTIAGLAQPLGCDDLGGRT